MGFETCATWGFRLIRESAGALEGAAEACRAGSRAESSWEAGQHMAPSADRTVTAAEGDKIDNTWSEEEAPGSVDRRWDAHAGRAVATEQKPASLTAAYDTRAAETASSWLLWPCLILGCLRNFVRKSVKISLELLRFASFALGRSLLDAVSERLIRPSRSCTGEKRT